MNAFFDFDKNFTGNGPGLECIAQEDFFNLTKPFNFLVPFKVQKCAADSFCVVSMPFSTNILDQLTVSFYTINLSSHTRFCINFTMIEDFILYFSRQVERS